MKILLFGKDGQVGWELQRSLAPLGEVIAPSRNDQGLCGNLADLGGLAKTICKVSPDVIVNAAAYTAVDKAESEPELARVINAMAPGVLAQEAKRSGALFVHYSTDYVFNGGGTVPWLETDPAFPLNIYGTTKLEGERAICTTNCQHLIFRTSWVYAARGNNFVKAILRLAQEQESLAVVSDQVGAPTGADLLADITAHTIGSVLQRPEMAGLYHLAASGYTSFHEYASFILDFAQRANLPLRVASDAIRKISTSAFPTVAKRPCNSRLGTKKLQSTFGLHLPDWRAGVTRVLTEILDTDYDKS
jgi:dTDP-4-dehydrorhamnose reductase